MPILLDLPPELLILTFCFLDLPALVALLATNRRVNSIIDESKLLRYRRAAQAACVEDNGCNTSLTPVEKTTALQRRERAFLELRPSSVRTIQMDDFPINYGYSLSAGVFIMTEADEKALRWTSLAAIETVWERLELDEYILQFNLAVPHDDLLVVVSSATPRGTPREGVNLRLYEFSTQAPHPMAQAPVIPLPEPHSGSFYDVDICGPRLSILFDCEMVDEVMTTRRLLVYDWKRNRLLLDLTGEYSTTVFISLDTILLAPVETVSLELWSISDDGVTPMGPEVLLKLPQLKSPGLYLLSRVESNPKGYGSSSPHQPFHASFADSLLVFDVDIELEPHIGSEDESDDDLLLVIPRRALERLLHGPAQHGKEAPFYLCEWPTVFYGQRCAFVHEDGRLIVYDFNAYTHRRLLLEEPGGQFRRGSTAVNTWREGEPLIVAAMRDEEWELGQLGYVESSIPVKYRGVLMDDEWIVGINDREELDGKFSIEVWHMC
ncbi:hypothetical protein C8R46DRAFT_1082955 [Mycena filopes]|nr:hypothetical protein C8R46DRAFT_1082955 [Mycena filopes]